MVLNFPGPYQVRLNYTVDGRKHQQRLNVDETSGAVSGLPFASYDLATFGAADVDLQVAVDNWISLIDNIFNTAATAFIDAELWKFTPGGNDAVFWASYTIGETGAGGGAAITDGQARMSFISQEGGTMFLDFMESTEGPAPTDSFPFPDASVDAIADFVIGATNWILAKDTSYPVAARFWNPGINEALFKKTNRP
jgi:hypothetical protein